MDSQKKVVFIIGCGHSGSTLLDLILGSHSQAFSLGELRYIGSLLPADAADSAATRICDICEDICDFWNRKANIRLLKLYYSRQTYLQRALGRLALYMYNPYRLLFDWSGKSILIDSSKAPGWIMRQLSVRHTWGNIEPYLLFICRDGRAVVNSFLRKYPERNIADKTKEWLTQINKMKKYYADFPEARRMRVHYEELATHPREVSEQICHLLDIDFEPEMLRYWRHAHHIIRGNAGTRSLIYKYRAKFEVENEKLAERDSAESKYYDDSYYQQVGMSIYLDQRWKRELTPEQLAIFDSLAGEANREFEYVSPESVTAKR